jgi:aminopeptidase N
MKDAADMWIHEGFTNYTENLFVEYYFGKEDAQTYVIGSRHNVRNDKPIIGTYDTNREGSGDMYAKGGNMLHTIRHIINDDEKWRGILRGLNKDFWHQTVTTAQVESYISKNAGIDLSKVFDQYLRTKDIPILQYKIEGKNVNYKFDKVVKGFAMPVRVNVNGKQVQLTPTGTMQTYNSADEIKTFEIDRNFYVNAEKMN